MLVERTRNVDSDDRRLYDEFKRATIGFLGLKPGALERSRGPHVFSLARRIAMYLGRKHTDLTQEEIGRLTGKSASAVSQAFRWVSERLPAKDLLQWIDRYGTRRTQHLKDVVTSIEERVLPRPQARGTDRNGQAGPAAGPTCPPSADHAQTGRVTLGVPGLDSVFPDGIQAGSLILLVGPPGSGKSTLMMQMLLEMDWRSMQSTASRARARGKAMFLSADESRESLERQRDILLGSRHSREVAIGRLFSYAGLLPTDTSETRLADTNGEALELFIASLEKDFPGIAPTFCAVGLDGVANIPELSGGTPHQRRCALRQTAMALRDLMRRTRQVSLAAIMTAELPTAPDELGVSHLEEYLADVVIRLGVKQTSPGKVRRYLEVPKARYVQAVLGQHSLCIFSEEEVRRQQAAAATLGWSREAMTDIRKGVVVFPGMRWERRRGTGPLSSNLEDALRNLREHVSRPPTEDEDDAIKASLREAGAIIRGNTTGPFFAALFGDGGPSELDWKPFADEVSRLAAAAVRSGWRWPSTATIEEICSANLPPLKLDWVDRLDAGLQKTALRGIQKILDRQQPSLQAEAHDGKVPAKNAEARATVKTLALDRRTVVKLRNNLIGVLGLGDWDEGRQNAATMGVLEALAMVQQRLEPRHADYCTFGVKGLDMMFGTHDRGGGVTRGSSTVIVGGPGTGKSMLAYCFLLQGLWGEERRQVPSPYGVVQHGPEEDVIFLSFDERHKRVLRDAGGLAVVDTTGRQSPTLSQMAASQILESDIRRAPAYPRFRFVYENPINADLNRLVHLLSKEIESLSPSRVMLGGQERRRCRLILDSLTDLERNVKDPRVFNDFVTTLLNQAIDWDVTTLVLYEAIEDQAGRPTGQLLSFMADNVVVLQHVQVNNIARKSVRVRKARGRNHDPSVAELVFRPHEDRSFHVEVRKGFEGMSHVLSAKPEPAKIELRLFVENQPEEEWNRRFVEEIEPLYPERVRYVPFRLEQIRSAFWHRLHQRDISPDTDVTVVSMDQPWVRTLSEQESPLLSRWDPAEADPAQKKTVEDLVDFLQEHASCDRGRIRHQQRMLAMPLYYDVGFFLRRTDLVAKNTPTLTYWDKPESAGPDHPSLEATLENQLETVRGQFGKDVQGFAFDMDNVNGVACMFIEMCWNFGASNAFFVTEDPARAQRDLTCATEALLLLARLRWKGLLPYPCTIEHCARALYTRIWYANIPELIDCAAMASHLRPEPFPLASSFVKKPVDLKDGTPVKRARSCSGEWYLGVLSSGGNANLGWSIVMEALDPRRVRDRAFKGAGLPPTKSFYLRYGDQPVPNLEETTFADLDGLVFEQTQSRMLAFGLGAKDSDGNPIKPADMDILSTMPEVLHDLVMRVLGDPKSHPDEGDNARKFVRDEVRKILQWSHVKQYESDKTAAKAPKTPATAQDAEAPARKD